MDQTAIDSDDVTWADEDDCELLRAFESCKIPHGEWDHRAHVRVGYLYLCRFGWPAALNRMRAGICALNASHDVPDQLDRGYHETITHCFLWLLHATVVSGGPCCSSSDFCDRHPELLEKRVLLTFYSKERLFSAEAKRAFVEPDVADLPAPRPPTT